MVTEARLSKEAKRGPGYAWVIAGGTFLLGICGIGSTMIWGFVSPFIAQEYGVQVTDIAIGTSLYGLFCSGLGLVVGLLGDRFGPRIICTLGALGLGLSMLLGGLLAKSLVAIIAFYALAGLFASGVSACLMPKLFASWFAPHMRGKGMAINTAGGSITGAILGIVAPLLILNTGWQGTFIVLGIVFMVCGLIFFVLVRDTPACLGTIPLGYSPEEYQQILEEERKARELAAKDPQKETGTLAIVLKMPVTWFFVLVFILWQVYFTVNNAYQTTAILEAGFSLTQAGLVGTISIIIMVLSQITGSTISDHFSRKKVFAVQAIGCGLSMGAIFLVLSQGNGQIWWLFVVFGFMGCFSGMAPLMQNLMGEVFPPAARGTGSGVILTVSLIGTFGGPLLGAAFVKFMGGSVMSIYLLSGLCLVLAGIISLLCFPNTGGKYGDPQAQ